VFDRRFEVDANQVIPVIAARPASRRLKSRKRLFRQQRRPDQFPFCPLMRTSPHYSREMRDQSQTVDIVHNYANGLFDEVFCNEISSPGVWWPGPISGGPMNYSG